tara:strand:+ start:2234 stop:2788 length:555 start_codon:yes stop_codon:yes gene_type:complete
MWALVKDGTVEEIYYSPKSIILDNVRYPSNMFTMYTKEEKKRIHIYDVKRKTPPDTNFYDMGSSSYTWNASEETVDEDFTITEKDLSDLKINSKAATDYEAYRQIQYFAWLTQRYVYDNTQVIPNDVIQYVASIRTFCNTICTAIDNCNTLDEFKVVHSEIFNEGEQYNVWPDSTSIEHYKRNR